MDEKLASLFIDIQLKGFEEAKKKLLSLQNQVNALSKPLNISLFASVQKDADKLDTTFKGVKNSLGEITNELKNIGRNSGFENVISSFGAGAAVIALGLNRLRQETSKPIPVPKIQPIPKVNLLAAMGQGITGQAAPVIIPAQKQKSLPYTYPTIAAGVLPSLPLTSRNTRPSIAPGFMPSISPFNAGPQGAIPLSSSAKAITTPIAVPMASLPIIKNPAMSFPVPATVPMASLPIIKNPAVVAAEKARQAEINAKSLSTRNKTKKIKEEKEKIDEETVGIILGAGLGTETGAKAIKEAAQKQEDLNPIIKAKRVKMTPEERAAAKKESDRKYREKIKLEKEELAKAELAEGAKNIPKDLLPEHWAMAQPNHISKQIRDKLLGEGVPVQEASDRANAVSDYIFKNSKHPEVVYKRALEKHQNDPDFLLKSQAEREAAQKDWDKEYNMAAHNVPNQSKIINNPEPPKKKGDDDYILNTDDFHSGPTFIFKYIDEGLKLAFKGVQIASQLVVSSFKQVTAGTQPFANFLRQTVGSIGTWLSSLPSRGLSGLKKGASAVGGYLANAGMEIGKNSWEGLKKISEIPLASYFQKMGAAASQAAMAFTVASASMLGFTRAASPRDFQDFEVAMFGVSIQIGRLFLPLIREATQKLIDLNNWFRSLTDTQRESIMVWGQFVIDGLMLAVSWINGVIESIINLSNWLARNIPFLSSFGAWLGKIVIASIAFIAVFQAIAFFLAGPLKMAILVAGLAIKGFIAIMTLAMAHPLIAAFVLVVGAIALVVSGFGSMAHSAEQASSQAQQHIDALRRSVQRPLTIRTLAQLTDQRGRPILTASAQNRLLEARGEGPEAFQEELQNQIEMAEDRIQSHRRQLAQNPDQIFSQMINSPEFNQATPIDRFRMLQRGGFGQVLRNVLEPNWNNDLLMNVAGDMAGDSLYHTIRRDPGGITRADRGHLQERYGANSNTDLTNREISTEESLIIALRNLSGQNFAGQVAQPISLYGIEEAWRRAMTFNPNDPQTRMLQEQINQTTQLTTISSTVQDNRINVSGIGGNPPARAGG